MTRRTRIAGLAVTVLLEVVFVAWQGLNSGSVKAEAEARAPAVELDRTADVRRRQDVPDTMKISMTKCEVVLPVRADAQPCVR